jgi:dTDP-4-amino-4,6-dideoxygalactose transaminase/flavin reductase (DIM6/NTAB) family NADH-FMN oxidoreductase RutF
VISPPAIDHTFMNDFLARYRYVWPNGGLHAGPGWRALDGKRAYVRDMPESLRELAEDSRWPAFFPSPICHVTLTDGTRAALEKVVGASIVNRFPYVLALSFCKQELSARHHTRRVFTEMLEENGRVAVQFLPPGRALDRAMDAILAVPEERTHLRIAHSGLSTRRALTNDAPVFDAAYMVYEAALAKPGKDLQGEPVYPTPWIDVGSHRVYFLEIKAIQLRQDIAEGRSQVRWRSLPAWEPLFALHGSAAEGGDRAQNERYQKGYTPHYAFPSSGTVAFESDAVENGMAVKLLPPLPEDQVEVDNDRARWPCFFPSSAGMITTWAGDGSPNLMPCGSTTVVSRHPLVIAPCVSYAPINVRYAPRATLDFIRRTGRFGCGVPFINDMVVDAMRYAGNISFAQDGRKVAHAGLAVDPEEWAPVLPALPVHFDCQVRREVRLGTHIMFLGEVRRIRVRADVTEENPLEWCPWANVVPVGQERTRRVSPGRPPEGGGRGVGPAPRSGRTKWPWALDGEAGENGDVVMNVPLARPAIGEEEIQAASAVLRSGWVIQGPEVAAFEREFADGVGASHACAVSSCTTALHLALLVVGVRPGDEVITVSHSFVATASSIRYCGATPVFVDIQPGTFNMDPALIERAVTERTRAILCVHQMGMPCDLGEILRIAHRRSLPVVEDAACAIGSEILWNGAWQRVGRPHGDIACFSFHPRKLITTGDGGMITTSDQGWDARLRLWRHHGMSAPATERYAAREVVFESYEMLGYNYRMTDIQAAVGRVQLRRLPEVIERRRSLADRYRELLADVPGVGLPQEPAWARSNWQSYCVQLPEGQDQRAVMQAMVDAGISTRRGTMCAHREPAYPQGTWSCAPGSPGCQCPAGSCAQLRESERAQDQGVTLPLFPQMTEAEQDAVVAALRVACAGRRW